MTAQISTKPNKEPLLSLSSSPLPPLVPAGGTPPSSSSSKAPGSGNHCSVCDDVAQANTIFRRHYGVICCEACKCFFRRTVQMGRDYKCRFSGSCPVGRNAINIKQVCQACRFNRCTQAGMKIDCKFEYLESLVWNIGIFFGGGGVIWRSSKFFYGIHCILGLW